MNLRRVFAPATLSTAADLALLMMRLICGVAFMFHGWGKIRDPFGWMGPDGFAPGWLQALAALSEFGGGLAWTLGLLTPLASFGLACTMGVATCFHAITRGDPFVSMTGGPSYELAAVFLSIALVLLTAGPGRFSLDRLLFSRRS